MRRELTGSEAQEGTSHEGIFSVVGFHCDGVAAFEHAIS
jgi:hypothetical protein